MSDNIQIVPSADEAPKKKRIPWRLVLFALIAAVLIFALVVLLSDAVAFDGLKRAVRYLGKTPGQYGHIDLDGAETSEFSAMSGNLVLLDGSALRIFNENGSLRARVALAENCNALCISEKRALCYAIGGKAYLVCDRDGNTLQKADASGEILDADLNDSGEVALLCAGEGTRAVFELYGEAGDLLYRYRSSSQYLNACAVSPDGKSAVVIALGQKDVLFRSAALLLRTDSEDAPIELSLGEQLIFDVAFLDAQTICAIGEKSVLTFDTDGNLRSEYSLDGAAAVSYRFVSGGVLLALDTFSAAERYRVVLLDADGAEELRLSADAQPLCLSAQGNYLAVLTAQSLTVYDRSARVRLSLENAGKYTFAAVRKDGTVLAAGSAEADLIFP